MTDAQDSTGAGSASGDGGKASGATAPNRKPGTWTFSYETSTGQVQSFSIDESALMDKGHFAVGRNPKSSDYVLTDFSISRDHCVFSVKRPGTLLITDIGSSNGTFVNEARINPNEAHELNLDDHLEIGNLLITLAYEAGPEVSAAASPDGQAASKPEPQAEPAPAGVEAVAAKPPAAGAKKTTDAGAAAGAASSKRPGASRGEPKEASRAKQAAARRRGEGDGMNWVGRVMFGGAIIVGVFAIVFGQAGELGTSGYQLIGGAVLAAVAIQVVAMTWSSMRRASAESAYYDQQVAMLRNQVKASSAHMRAERDRATLTWNGIRKYRIDRKVPEGGGICSFYLKPHDGKGHPPFDPGQYLTFQLKIPGKDKPVIRCYSLSDSPMQRDYYRVSIKKVPPPRDRPDLPSGLSSSFFHDQLEEGDILDVKAPSGKFFMDQTKHTPVVLIGGGVGLTPVMSMVNTIALSGSKRETHFFYGVRNSKEHVMKEHLEQLARDHENIHLHVCYSNPEEGEEEGRDYQHAERVSVDLFKRTLPSNNYDFYICGPPPMMESLVKDLGEWGVPEANVHFEAFGPASVKKAKPKPAEDASAAPAEAIEVEFAKSGKKVAWDASFDSLLEFGEAQGIAMDSGCRAGNCGTCITAVKSGDVKYVEEPGAAPESGSCLVCVSVPKGNLVLEA